MKPSSTPMAAGRALVRWIGRRPDIPDDATAFKYAKDIGPIMWAILIASLVEVGIFHLLLSRWPTVQLAVDVLTILVVVYTIGLTANVYVYPHLADASGLTIRYGASAVHVPWSAIADIRARRVPRDGMRTFQVNDDPAVLSVVVGGQTTVDLALAEPMTFPLRREAATVHRIQFHADDPGAVIAQVRLAR